jgi:hypothetical protein
MQKLQAFDETIVWINKEEMLLQFPVSTYPELDELKVCTIFFSLVQSDAIYLVDRYQHLEEFSALIFIKQLLLYV